ncbi:MAG: type II toxin-antitoxin system RelB/DinJ family antitoxin [Dehalococcoidia bacterium]|nr:type II toxin-antitoxin system RelB/DinJ family antitoxin [Dehalococcoidia bacterium]
MTISENTGRDVRVTIRVDKALKEQAEVLFECLGMNMSTALNVFLRKAVDEEAIPFHISIKKASYSACKASECSADATAGQNSLEKNQPKESHVAQSDARSSTARAEVPDVSCEYVNRYGKPVV